MLLPLFNQQRVCVFERAWIACMYVPHTHGWRPRRLEKDARSHVIVVTNLCELPGGSWELKRVLLRSSQCYLPSPLQLLSMDILQLNVCFPGETHMTTELPAAAPKLLILLLGNSATP